MADVKENIERREAESSPYFYGEIWNEEVDWMCETYLAIDRLSAKAFQFLWAKA